MALGILEDQPKKTGQSPTNRSPSANMLLGENYGKAVFK